MSESLLQRLEEMSDLELLEAKDAHRLQFISTDWAGRESELEEWSKVRDRIDRMIINRWELGLIAKRKAAELKAFRRRVRQ
jgi:hypothetical protein